MSIYPAVRIIEEGILDRFGLGVYGSGGRTFWFIFCLLDYVYFALLLMRKLDFYLREGRAKRQAAKHRLAGWRRKSRILIDYLYGFLTFENFTAIVDAWLPRHLLS